MPNEGFDPNPEVAVSCSVIKLKNHSAILLQTLGLPVFVTVGRIDFVTNVKTTRK